LKDCGLKIGIIGTGSIGSTLARKLAAAGHEVKIANSRGPGSLADLAKEIGAQAVARDNAVQDVEVVILSLPFAAYSNLKSLLSAISPKVAVLDTSNYYPMRDGEIAGVDGEMAESAWVGEQLGRSVIKTWNAVLAQTLAEHGRPAGAVGRLALPVAGDDPAAKAIALQLVEETGFDAFDAGSIAESWRHQPGTPAYCTELSLEELKPALAAANRDQAPSYRDAIIQEFIAADGGLSHEQTVARNREVTA
jgi:predicted dinucleotide-binding enzyme